MSSIKKPHGWLCLLAFAAAFWITFRVMASDAPAHPSARSPFGEIDDPALHKMIARYANDANDANVRER